ncbi:hypothetical protein GF373_02015 [bacterium]|nr:hypothetical protein [bacterium]
MKRCLTHFRRFLLIGVVTCLALSAQSADPWLVLDGFDGPGNGKHIVIVTGDDEYRSEESMPQLARILAKHHGFKCTVLFAIDPETGEIKPDQQNNIPGLHNLESADLMIVFTRFRDLPDEQMKHFVDYVNSGKPMMGLRTATHAFNFRQHKTYDHYSFRSKEWQGGFGRQVLGETWINHYGKHKKESTRGLIVNGFGNEVIAKGCDTIWGPSDVYGLTTLEGHCRPIVMGQVLTGMEPDDPPLPNKPIVPVAWTKTYTGYQGKPAKVFTTTMGHSGDLKDENFRRLLVNACYWSMDMEDQIPDKAKVDIVGDYDPNPIGMKIFKKGIKPADYQLN